MYYVLRITYYVLLITPSTTLPSLRIGTWSPKTSPDLSRIGFGTWYCGTYP